MKVIILYRSTDCFRLGWPMRPEGDFFKGRPKEKWKISHVRNVCRTPKIKMRCSGTTCDFLHAFNDGFDFR